MNSLIFIATRMKRTDAAHCCSEGIRFLLQKDGRNFDPAMAFLLAGLLTEKGNAIALEVAPLIVDEDYASQAEAQPHDAAQAARSQGIGQEDA